MPLRIAALGLVAIGLATFAPPASAHELEREEIETIVREYLLENPDVVADALRKQREIEAAKAEVEQKKAAEALISELRDDPMIPRVGSENPKVTMVEFFDYNCGYCRRVAESVFTLIEEEKDLQVLLVELPVLGDGSIEAAQVALAAAKQDKYWEFHQAMLRERGRANAAFAAQVAVDAGADAQKLAEALNDESIDAALKSNVERARRVRVTGTPAFIIGDRVIPGAVPLAELRKAVAEARGS